MKTFRIPYSQTYQTIDLPEERLAGTLESKAHTYGTTQSQEEIVKAALDHPIGSCKLRELAQKAKKVLLITSDHTRPVPSRVTLPLLLKEIRSKNPSVEIKILIATGFTG